MNRDKWMVIQLPRQAGDNPMLPSLLNNSFISLLNAFAYKNAADVVDGIILWEC